MKYEVTESGEFVFEKGRDSLNVDGSAVSFSNVTTRSAEPNETPGFDWESAP